MFLNTTTMTVTTEDGGRQNMYAKEPQIEVMDQDYATSAELANGRWAMIGFVAAIGHLSVLPVVYIHYLYLRFCCKHVLSSTIFGGDIPCG